MKLRTTWGALICLLLTSAARAQSDGTVILDMDSLHHRVGEVTDAKNQKVPAGTAELVEGKFGKAVKFSFIENARGGFMTAAVPGTAEWDTAEGFSFWVKGDGSASWGGIEMIDRSNYGLRYGYCFPIHSTQWQKIVVPWSDLIPELAGPLVDAQKGYKPSGFGSFWFGKWFYWREYPAHSYTIDQIALEKRIQRPAPLMGDGLKRVREKLAQKKALTIVTMGDSLSDARHWANRPVLWSQELMKQIKEKSGVEAKLVNPAIGGTTLSQNMILMPRWLAEAPRPDLVIIWFGGNDWDSGVRGERFTQYLRLAVDRARRMTEGSADVLLLTTCPGHGRWQTMVELEEAVRTVAREKRTGLADPAGEFRKAGTPDELLKQNYWAWDKVHLGAKGHEVVKSVVLKAMEAGE